MNSFFAVGKDIDIMANDERNLEVMRYSSGADSTLGLLFVNGPQGREFWLTLWKMSLEKKS